MKVIPETRHRAHEIRYLRLSTLFITKVVIHLQNIHIHTQIDIINIF